MPQTVNLGKVCITPKGEFSASVSYERLDAFSYNGSSYLVIAPVTGMTPPNDQFYMRLAERGTDGSGGAAATVQAGSVNTVPAGNPASVQNSGTESEAVFDFTIPTGNVWYAGTAITGTPTAEIFIDSGVTNAGIGDLYLNTETGYVYRCVVLGAPDVARWTFAINLKQAPDLDQYAKTTGTYPNLVAGSAEQLLSSVGVTDKVPYTLRASGGGLAIGNRETDKVVGGTVAWNQVIINGNFEDTTGWAAQTSASSLDVANNVATVTLASGTASVDKPAISLKNNAKGISGHKYFLTLDVFSPVSDRLYNYSASGAITSPFNNKPVDADTWTTVSAVASAARDSDMLFSYVGFYNARNNLVIGDSIKFRRCFVVDLTAMFGTAIADYIYSLEQAAAGAGVAKLKSWGFFTEDYYAYNPGELMSVNTSAHVMRDAAGDVVGNYALDSALTLRGIPKLDANNNLYYDGDTYESNGTVTRKYELRPYVDGGHHRWKHDDNRRHKHGRVACHPHHRNRRPVHEPADRLPGRDGGICGRCCGGRGA